MSTIEELQKLREREDHVEFKKAEHNYPFAGGQKTDPKDRRHCVLGYVVALANEKGGRLVLGMADAYPHEVAGSDFVAAFDGILTQKQVRNLIEGLCKTPLIASHGNARATRYSWINSNT